MNLISSQCHRHCRSPKISAWKMDMNCAINPSWVFMQHIKKIKKFLTKVQGSPFRARIKSVVDTTLTFATMWMEEPYKYTWTNSIFFSLKWIKASSMLIVWMSFRYRWHKFNLKASEASLIEGATDHNEITTEDQDILLFIANSRPIGNYQRQMVR